MATKRIAHIHQLTQRLIVMTLVTVLVFSAVFAASFFFNDRFMISWAAFLCGIIGGFVSIQQRVKSVSDDELELLTNSWFQILLVPVFGGVFALVLYTLFLSGIVSGHLFPEFYVPPPKNGVPDSDFMVDIFRNTYPMTGQDFAKFMFWSFAAGFSERFVPQIINKVSHVNDDKSDDEKKEQND